MNINWKKIGITVTVGAVILYILFSFLPHGLAQERMFANQVISAEQYQFMIEYVQENGIDGTMDGNAYKYLVYDISPAKKSRRVIRIIEFITITTHVNYDDGGKLVSSFHMDDADMDRMPDSIIQITMRWDAEGNIIEEDARSLSTLMPIWTRYLAYVYEQMTAEIEGVDP